MERPTVYMEGHRQIKLSLIDDMYKWKKYNKQQKKELIKKHIFYFRDADINVNYNNGEYLFDPTIIENSEKKPTGVSLLNTCLIEPNNPGYKEKEFKSENDSWEELLDFLDTIHKDNSNNVKTMSTYFDKTDDKFRYLCLKLPAKSQQITPTPYIFHWEKRKKNIYHLGICPQRADFRLTPFKKTNRMLFKPDEEDYDIGINNAYEWIPCCTILKARSEPIWRYNNTELDGQIVAILERLLYAEEYAASSDEEDLIKDTIKNVLKCQKTKNMQFKLSEADAKCIDEAIDLFNLCNDESDEYSMHLPAYPILNMLGYKTTHAVSTLTNVDLKTK